LVYKNKSCLADPFFERIALFENIKSENILSKKFVKLEVYDDLVNIIKHVQKHQNQYDGIIHNKPDSSYTEKIYKWKFNPTVDLIVNDDKICALKQNIEISKGSAPESCLQYNKQVCEFTIINKDKFEFYRVRPDKKNPNSDIVVNQTIEHKLEKFLDFDAMLGDETILFSYYLQIQINEKISHQKFKSLAVLSAHIPQKYFVKIQAKSKQYTKFCKYTQVNNKTTTILQKFSNLTILNKNKIDFSIFIYLEGDNLTENNQEFKLKKNYFNHITYSIFLTYTDTIFESSFAKDIQPLSNFYVDQFVPDSVKEKMVKYKWYYYKPSF
jgi:hypothetical protein